jgi:glycosyltransferase involved in cell wall biosynthesis
LQDQPNAMTAQPLVSIIIPTYNRAHLIGETLDSVLAQTYQNWECIIVDDGSSDNTDEFVGAYVEKDSRFKYFHRPDEHLPGGNGARNYGFKMSQGEYIQWFDSDDLMAPEKIDLNIKLFLRKNISLVISSYSEFNSKTIFEVANNLNLETNLFDDLVQKKVKINTPSSFWKKSFLTDKNLFDEKILKGQELDFYSRIFYENKIDFDIINIATSFIRRGDDGILNEFHNGENIEMIKSFLEVRKNIHLMVLDIKDTNLFFEVFKFQEKILLKLIKHKHYTLVNSQLNFLLKNSPSTKNGLYKVKILKYLLFIKLMKITNGKNFYGIKKTLKIK